MSGLIPKHYIENLLAKVDIVDVVGKRIALKKSGKNYSACCPFHSEKTPSFTVSQDKQFYHCFGCGVNGNAIGFIMAYDSLDFREAVKLLSETAGMSIPDSDESRKDSEVYLKTKSIYSINEHANKYFSESLKHSPDALNYVRKRGLNDYIIDKYSIGFSKNNWDYLTKTLINSGWKEDIVIESGLSVKSENENKVYDRFRNRIMFPIRNVRGQIAGFGGRAIGDVKPKYLNTSDTIVFAKSKELYGLFEALSQAKKPGNMMVVEGYMDVVSLAQSGISNVVAALGTAINSDQVEKIFNHTSSIIFCFDGDSAGRNAAVKSLDAVFPKLTGERVVKYLLLDSGHDPDSFIKKYGVDTFKDKIDKSVNLSEFIFEIAANEIDTQSVEGRMIFIERCLKYIKKIPDGFFSRQMITELALRSKSNEKELHDFLIKNISQSSNEYYFNEEREIAPVVDQIQKTDEVNQNKNSDFENEISNIDKKISALLLKNPGLAEFALIDEKFSKDLDVFDGELIFPLLLKIINANKNTSQSRIIGLLWAEGGFGEESWQLLQNELSAPFPKEALENDLLIRDYVNRIRRIVGIELPLEALVQASAARSLTEFEKSQLKELLRQKAY